ncbi:MAG: hypothetical protein AAGA28_12475 [Pseudomonadota bacterium]
MEDLVRALGVGIAISLMAATASAKATNQLHCSTTSCSWTEEIGPSGTKSFQGYCDGVSGVNKQNSKMVCHKTDGTTCTVADFIDDGASTGSYWSCTCTNWNDKHDEHPVVDLSCPAS